MILARINDEPRLFDTWDELGEATFCPGNTVEIITDFHLHGKTYAERKAEAHEIAVDFSYNFPVDCYWSDVLLLYELFEKWGRRYGLLDEFRENAIC